MFSFGNFWVLFHMIWVVPLLVGLLYLRYLCLNKRYDRISRFQRYSGRLFVRTLSKSRQFLSGTLLVLASVFLIISIAKPRIGFKLEEVVSSGSDIVVVLDLSKSMLCQDTTPSRLEVAKRKIKDLLGLVRGDRIGVVVFSGSSFVLCPLTKDYKIVDLFLDSLDYDSLLIPGTSLDEALESALSSLKEASYDTARSSSVILISDGEDHGKDLDQVLKKSVEVGVSISCLGIGTLQGGPIPLQNGGFQTDSSQNIVITKLNESLLQKISSKTGGVYTSLRTLQDEMNYIYQSAIIGSDESNIHSDQTRVEKEGKSYERVWNEKYEVFSLFALLCFLGSIFVEKVGSRSKDQDL